MGNDGVNVDVSLAIDETSHQSVGSGSSVSEGSLHSTSTKEEGKEGSDADTASLSGARYLIKDDSKRIQRSKLCLVVFIFLTAVTSSVGFYLFTQSVEEEDFHVRFRDFAHEILTVSEVNALHIHQVIEAMSLSMTRYALNTNATFPFVILENYEALAYEAVLHSGANFVGYSPLVEHKDRAEYEQYSYANQGWIQKGINYRGLDSNDIVNFVLPVDYIHCSDPGTNGNDPTMPFDLVRCEDAFQYMPVAQMSPVEETRDVFNYNAFNFGFFRTVYNDMIKAKAAVLSEVLNLYQDVTWETIWPVSFMAAPIFEHLNKIDERGRIVGVLTAELPWHNYFKNTIPDGIDGIIVVVRNTCDQEFTYMINGADVTYLGPGDLHDPAFDDLEESRNFASFQSIDACQYTFHLYPSQEFKNDYTSSDPITNAISIFVVFLVTALIFIGYDVRVQRRQKKLLMSAESTGALVNSLFPKNVRDRLIDEEAKKSTDKEQQQHAQTGIFRRSQQTDKVPRIAPSSITRGTSAPKPIADLFPKATVLFSDIAGFTAWSSMREPAQVFTLLETLYGSFDRIARKLKVFKVETIGDCYVATTGLPEPTDDHAIIMARFARRILVKTNQIVHDLESTLGPGTSSLAMRVGIHSGPVTAGVLRGEKSRFQLFGDTVNTAARMESTGTKNQIQVSQQTAELLITAGKTSWVKPRDDVVTAKGKGQLQTYWLLLKTSSSTSSSSHLRSSLRSSTTSTDHTEPNSGYGLTPRNIFTREKELERLIDWNVDFLQQPLRKIVALREASSPKLPEQAPPTQQRSQGTTASQTVLEELEETLRIRQKPAVMKVKPEFVELDSTVLSELRDFVATIANLYKDHPYHNFAHATHVAQSLSKLFSRMLSSDSIDYSAMSYKHNRCAVVLHETTYGIASDPLVQFAISFTALIINVDHPGLSNKRLVDEKHDMAALYNNKCVAEQNSIEVAWELLMEPSCEALRNCLFADQSEVDRFRKMIVNGVLASDVEDAELNAARSARWSDSFDPNINGLAGNSVNICDVTDRKATAIIEAMIQASDLSHTMQHWHVYIEWNERSFDEMYQAYLSDKSREDPSTTWYEREKAFFQDTVLPLARHLTNFCVFGAAADEYMNYADMNSKEWEMKGEEMVKHYMEKYSH